jgi:decaprenylphospho-beta-D-ribofuranose 2-oxidase
VTPAAPREPSIELLAGWGNAAPTAARVHTPASAGEAAGLVSPDPQMAHQRGLPARGLLARGLGRAYGDAAQNAGGLVLRTSALNHIDLDESAAAATVGAGVSLDALLRVTLPRGLFVPVTPGTRWVSCGGALACDVHGKNHHVDGSWSRHVSRFGLATPRGMLEDVLPGSPEFAATAGGMGLTGLITDLTLRLIRVPTSAIVVDTERTADLDACMARMLDNDADYRYSVAWLDCLAGSGRTGRGVLTRGNHAEVADLPARARHDPLRYAPATRLAVPPVPPGLPSGLLSRRAVTAFNAAYYHRAPARATTVEPLVSYFYPLDVIAHWNRMYGARGFLQYQYAVPYGQEEVVRQTLRRLEAAGCPSYLAVFKRFGPQDGLLAFPLEGWTLALDLPAAAPGLGRVLDGLDELVAAAGGRIYLAKDSRLRPDLLAAMYPRLDEWRAIRDKLDPEETMRSDLSRRLGLAGADAEPRGGAR